MKTFLVRGVPQGLQQDGWWLSPPPPRAPSAQDPDRAEAPPPIRLAVLAGLICVGDVLLWDVVPGLSLALFALICFGAAAFLWPRPVPSTDKLRATCLATLSVCPVIELVQPLSIMFLLGGLPLSLAALSGRRMRGALRYWWAGPLHSLRDGLSTLYDGLPKGDLFTPMQRLFVGWALPVGVGLVFASLLISANPLLEDWLNSVPSLSFPEFDATRLVFWAGLAVVIWPALTLVWFAAKLLPDKAAPRQGPIALPPVLNGPAIARSLVLFNALFAVQNAMDLLFLSGGVRLPAAMSFAEYAHRGAYPLVALALLSGGFAVLARPFITAAPVVRMLLIAWVAQTIWLTLSSGLRLDLYVESYGLTRLRMAAAIWMGMVACGLALILWQIGQARSTYWLVRRVAGLGLAVLYGCCFIDFDAAIAGHNLRTQSDPDMPYICALGEGAVPALVRYTGLDPVMACARHTYVAPEMSVPEDLREWGFRNARLRHSLAQHQQQTARP